MNNKKNIYQPTLLAVTIFAGLFANTALASGYHFGTQSVTVQSTANASAAEAVDASTLFYNVAGLSKLEGTNISINANLVAPSVKYKNSEASYPAGMPANVTGATRGQIAKSLVVAPHFYASHQLNDQLTVGLGVYVPFGSGTEYQRDSVLRYNVNKMDLKTIDINPTLSYKINDHHSVGIGLIGQYTIAGLRNYANFGSIAGVNGGADGFVDIEGTDWGFGYNIGYLWDVNDKVRLGANYRSKVEHTLKGDAEWKFANPNAPLTQAIAPGIRGANYLPSEKTTVKIVTPESLSLHGMVKIDPKWTAFGDITWTRHSRFNTLNINYENIKQPSNTSVTILKPNWKDTFKFSLGAAYQYSDPLQLRFGIAYDQSPVRGVDQRLTTLPDNDRIWFSLGAKYNLNKNSSLNLGYSYIHIKDAKANVNGYCGGATPGSVACVSSQTRGSAEYKSNAHILGVQYNYHF
ncbi:MAG: hypothetical protein CSA45_03425 [Gammaproteobacteria bacterium]|nr:MAG: hypothetical protein CSA45_03425 [Gammaproteobacteria bacterium]